MSFPCFRGSPVHVVRKRLQCSALMYERSSEAPIAAARTAASYIKNRTANKLTNWSYAQPGQRATEACGKEGAAEIKKSLKDSAEDKIATIAAGLGLEYCTVSDLNTVGSSFCGLFWNPQDTFIIVAFKGTTPTDFKEWKTDFTFHFKDGNSWLQGFDKGLFIYTCFHLRCETEQSWHSTRGVLQQNLSRHDRAWF